MRSSTVAFLLVFSMVLATFTEAGIADTISDAVKKAAEWVKENCTLSVTGVTCKGIKVLRKKRSAEDKWRHAVKATLDNACSKFDLGDNAKFSDVMDVALEQMDDNKDGSLGMDESVRFTQLMGVLDYCADLKKKQQPKTTREPQE